MTGLVWALEAVLLGCLLVCRFSDLPAIRPAWARLLLIFGAGAAGGIGLVSYLFFLVGVLLGLPVAAIVLELALLAWAAFEVYRRRVPVVPSGVDSVRPLLFWVAGGSLFLGLALAASAAWTGWDANPQGNWDAWAIWNLRARFLAAPAGLARRAWSPVLGATTHAEYPLLLSSFIGRCWAFGHSFATLVPAATSAIFFLALIALAAGAVAVLRGPTLGLLAALVLVSTPSLLHEIPAQYADVPLACYIAGAIVFALLRRPVLAGIFAGFGAWTKDEGLLFLVVFLAAAAVFRRREALAAIAGALPAAAILTFFKVWLARGNGSLLSTSLPGAGHRIFDIGRYGTVIAAFGRGFLDMAQGWYHPILPLVVLAAALRFDRERRRDAAFSGAIGAALLMGYFGVYVLTQNDLVWQLQTSLDRLLVQIWPVLVLTAMVALRVPEAAVLAEPAPAQKMSKKAARKARR
ncbi:MAG: hypothetical protein ABSH56_30800 [Bryobacteraceae bacterium]|jgi:hypothetical protein